MGPADGLDEGALDGAAEGSSMGPADGLDEGALDGADEGLEGATLGASDGSNEGDGLSTVVVSAAEDDPAAKEVC